MKPDLMNEASNDNDDIRKAMLQLKGMWEPKSQAGSRLTPTKDVIDRIVELILEGTREFAINNDCPINDKWWDEWVEPMVESAIRKMSGQLLNSIPNAPVSDTTNDDSSNTANPQIKNIPERIYLQVGNDDSDGDFKDLSQVSWCQDRIYPSDIAYVLAKPQISDECDATKAK